MGKLFDKIRRVQDKTRPFCSAIVPAAGSSTRMLHLSLQLPLLPQTPPDIQRFLLHFRLHRSLRFQHHRHL